jgi:hypothetical protein
MISTLVGRWYRHAASTLSLFLMQMLLCLVIPNSLSQAALFADEMELHGIDML